MSRDEVKVGHWSLIINLININMSDCFSICICSMTIVGHRFHASSLVASLCNCPTLQQPSGLVQDIHLSSKLIRPWQIIFGNSKKAILGAERQILITRNLERTIQPEALW